MNNQAHIKTNPSYRCGNEPRSGLYYEALGDRVPGRPPVVFIHGGGATGAAFRQTPDGRTGWADLLAAQGYECWVTDWPGGGRSGGRKNPLDILYADVVAGYHDLITDIIQVPCIIVCHSMGGPTTWAVVELTRALVAGVVSVAASAPGNLPVPESTIVSDDGTTIAVKFGITGVQFVIDRTRTYIYEDTYLVEQGIANSARFHSAMLESFRAGLVGIPPLLFMQKMGVLEGFPNIERTDVFRGLRWRAVAGDRDPAHTYEIERRTLDLLDSWGVDTELVWLPDLGIFGNGHFVYAEENSDDILEVVKQQIDAVATY